MTIFISTDRARARHAIAIALDVPTDDTGSHCQLCGPSPFASAGPRARVLGIGFSDWDVCDDPAAHDICAGCARLMAGRPGDDPPPLRMRSLLVVGGAFRTLAYQDVWPLLESPPDTPFVLSWATSGQKHHALRAGVSTTRRWAIGADDGVIRIRADEAAPIMASLLALRAGDDPKKPWCSRDEILSGRYRPQTIIRDPTAWEAHERIVAPVRGSPLLAFLVAHAPVRPSTLHPSSSMTDPIDTIAAELLLLLSRDSSYRVTHGKEFWAGVFARRVRRHAARPLPEFLSRMASDLQVTPISEAFRDAVARADALDPETAAGVTARLRTRTTLLVGLAFGAHQAAKDAAKSTTASTRKRS